MKTLVLGLFVIFRLQCIVGEEIFNEDYYYYDEYDFLEYNSDILAPVITSITPGPCSLLVDWTFDGDRENVTKFIVYWSESNTFKNDTSESVNRNESNFTIEGLLPSFEYFVQVSAVVYEEEEHDSEAQSNTTSHGAPPDIEDLKASDVTATTIKLRWSVAEGSCSEVDHFEIKWVGEVLWDPGRTSGGSMKTDENQYILKNLVPNTNYSITVQTFASDAGEGSDPEQIIEVTEDGEPGPPRNLEATAQNSSVITLTWDEPLELNGKLEEYVITWSLSSVEGEGGINSTTDLSFKVEGLLACGNYNFTVRAQNGAGNGESNFTTEKTWPEEPPPIEEFEVTELSATFANLTWVPPETNCPVLEYLIQGLGDVLWDDENDSEINETVDGNFTSYVLDLIPWTNYNISISPRTEGGTADWKYTYLQTPQSVPSEPLNLELEPDTPTTVTATWDPPEEENGEIVFYNITWYSGDDESFSDIAFNTSFLIDDLFSCNTYSVLVTASTEAGEGPAIEDSVIPLTEVPPPPGTLKCRQKSSTSILVEWEASDTKCQVLTYSLEADGTLLWNDNSTYSSAETDGLEYAFEELIPFTEYLISVTATTSAGTGDANSCKSTTAEDVPGVPESVKIKEDSIKKKSFEVEWTNPVVLNGVLLGFSVSCDGDTSYVDAVTEPNNRYSFTCEDLKPKTKYTASVAGETKAGVGESITVSTNTKSNAVGITLGILIPVIIIAVLAGLAYNYREQLRHRLEYMRRAAPSPASEGSTHVNTRPIPIDHFKSHVNKLKNGNSLSVEFEALKSMSSEGTTYEANRPENELKNRYSNILPYDTTRVPLHQRSSSYINANYIDSFSREKFFIASQGPQDNTLEDFWSLIWQEKVDVVVMLTCCYENGKEKCSQYWPKPLESGTTIGDFSIQNVNEETTPTFHFRILEVTHRTDDVKRLMRQFQFNTWPDFGAPSKEDELLRFLQSVRENLNKDRGRNNRILVHCSAGVGRTGTFICLWNIIELIESGVQSLNVFNEVLNLRRQRMQMVQSKEQYMYLNKCIVEYIEHKDRWQTQGREPVSLNSSGNVSNNYDEYQNSTTYDNQSFEMNQDFEGNLI